VKKGKGPVRKKRILVADGGGIMGDVVERVLTAAEKRKIAEALSGVSTLAIEAISRKPKETR
jgi:hypothetical protein